MHVQGDGQRHPMVVVMASPMSTVRSNSGFIPRNENERAYFSGICKWCNDGGYEISLDTGLCTKCSEMIAHAKKRKTKKG